MHAQRLQHGTCRQAFTAQPCGPRVARAVRAHAATAATTGAESRAPAAAAPEQLASPLIVGVVEALFKWKPLFNMAATKARKMIVERGEAIGLDWEGTMQKMRQHDWEAELAQVVNYHVNYPDYYTQPFHAYERGNLSWDSALEVTLAAQSVHAGVMDPANKEWRTDGDHMLRSNYGARIKELMRQRGVDPGSVRSIADMGCATGLSSLALLEAFPSCRHLTGVDLSPYFLAVGRYEQREREAVTGVKEPIEFVHAPAEATGLPAGSFDLVSMCLVAHELPQAATRAVLKEAHRLLKPGGVMAIMEMNPASPAFQRIFSNPFAFTAFKSTEPHLAEYITLDLGAAFVDAGFETPGQLENTPRHRTVVAVKRG